MYAYHTYFYTRDKFSLASFKCYFEHKYLNLIDFNCDVNESCPWFFIGTVLATGPECIINIVCVMLGRRNLFEMGAVRSARDPWRSQPTFGHANANFSVFVDRIRKKFLKK